MLIPVAIFVVCLCAGVAGAARWLPPLAAGPVGGLAFFAVCGLLGAGLALVGVHIYSIVQELDRLGGSFGGVDKGELVAGGLEELLFDAGALCGLALIVFLLAPRDPTTGPEACPPTEQPS